jgi:hypothetical protein
MENQRLSDRIVFALELAVDQGDYKTGELLTRALELAMTRMSGGGDFTERREYSEQVESLMNRLDDLRAKG